MLPLVLALSLLSGQARDAGTPWPFVGTSPVMRPGPPAGSGVLARYLNPTQGTVSFSGVTFTRSSAGAACTAADGTVTFPASGVPCLAGGYHARPAIANLLVQTNAFDNAAWVQNGTPTVTANAVVAPDGTLTADRVAPSGATSRVEQVIVASAAAGAYTVSVYALGEGAAHSAKVAIYDATAAVFVADPGPVAVAGTWSRLTVPLAAATAGHTLKIVVWPDPTGVGTTDFWGAQAVTGSLPLDYCPSGSTPATCAAEVATVPTPSGMSRTEGCAKVCFAPSFTGANPTAAVLALLSANTGGTARLASVTASAQSVAATDGTHAATRTTTLTAGTRACYVTKWSASAGTISVTDVTAGTTTSASGFTTLGALGTTLSIGAENGLSQPLGAVLDSIVIGSSPGACQ